MAAELRPSKEYMTDADNSKNFLSVRLIQKCSISGE